MVSSREVQFLRLWERLPGGESRPAPQSEYRFATAINRKWRFDFAWPALMVAVEIDGGVTRRRAFGRHVRADGFINDAEKLNWAAAQGWIVLRYTSADLDARPAQVVETVQQILEARRTELGKRVRLVRRDPAVAAAPAGAAQSQGRSLADVQLRYCGRCRAYRQHRDERCKTCGRIDPQQAKQAKQEQRSI